MSDTPNPETKIITTSITETALAILTPRPAVQPDPIITSSANMAMLLKSIQNTIGEEKLSASNVITATISLMQLVESMPNLSGIQKKDLVISALKKFIRDNGGDVSLIDTVPTFIDAIVATENGKLTISQAEEVVIGCCIGFCTSLQNAKKAQALKK